MSGQLEMFSPMPQGARSRHYEDAAFYEAVLALRFGGHRVYRAAASGRSHKVYMPGHAFPSIVSSTTLIALAYASAQRLESQRAEFTGENKREGGDV